MIHPPGGLRAEWWDRGETNWATRSQQTGSARDANRVTGVAERAAGSVGTGSPGKTESVVGERAVQTGSEPTKGIARQRELTGDDIESSQG